MGAAQKFINQSLAYSVTAAKNLNIEVADFLAQRIAIEAQEIRSSDLIAARGCQGRRQ